MSQTDVNHLTTHLNIRAILPPEPPSTTPSARARNSLTPTADIVSFVEGTGAGPFGAFPRWIADLSGSNMANIIDDIPVTRN